MYDYSRVETSLDYYYDAEAAITSYCTIDYILDIRSMDKPQILEVVSFQITKLMNANALKYSCLTSPAAAWSQGVGHECFLGRFLL